MPPDPKNLMSVGPYLLEKEFHKRHQNRHRVTLEAQCMQGTAKQFYLGRSKAETHTPREECRHLPTEHQRSLNHVCGAVLLGPCSPLVSYLCSFPIFQPGLGPFLICVHTFCQDGFQRGACERLTASIMGVVPLSLTQGAFCACAVAVVSLISGVTDVVILSFYFGTAPAINCP